MALVGLRVGSASELGRRALAEAGVLLLPGTCLGSDDRHFRLGLGRQIHPCRSTSSEHLAAPMPQLADKQSIGQLRMSEIQLAKVTLQLTKGLAKDRERSPSNIGP